MTPFPQILWSIGYALTTSSKVYIIGLSINCHLHYYGTSLYSSPNHQLIKFSMLFTYSKEKISIKDWKVICSESTLSITLHLTDINYVHNGYTHIVAWIQRITKYVDIVFQINGPLYSSRILIPTQSWSNSVMAECTPFLENMQYILVVYNLSVWHRTIWRINISTSLCNHIEKLLKKS